MDCQILCEIVGRSPVDRAEWLRSLKAGVDRGYCLSTSCVFCGRSYGKNRKYVVDP